MNIQLHNITRIKKVIGILLLLVAFQMSSCTGEQNGLSQGAKTPVRVALVVNENGHANAATRATGTTEDKKYNETTDAGIEAERYVGTLRLLIFDSAGTLRFNRLFSRSATNPEERINFNTTNPLNVFMTVDFMLAPGTYKFRAVANEDTDWDLASLVVGTATLNQYDALEKLVTNTIKTGADLTTLVNSQKGIPMLGATKISDGGEAEFTIPVDAATAVTNPFTVETIALKRTLAKVELHLTNIDPTTNAVYTTAGTYQIKSVSIEGINQNYQLMEPSTVAVTETNPLETTSASITHNRGEAFTKQMVLSHYMAERKGVADVASATTIKVVVNKTGQTDDIVYTIPLYKTDDKTITGAKNYNIFRNHLYRVYCYLVGSDMPYVEIYYSDTDWTLVTRETYMGYGYNVEVEGNNVTISNTVQVCAPHSVTLKTISPTTFSDGTTQKTFTETAETATQSYTLTNVPASGNYLEVYYNDNDVKVKTFTK